MLTSDPNLFLKVILMENPGCDAFMYLNFHLVFYPINVEKYKKLFYVFGNTIIAIAIVKIVVT